MEQTITEQIRKKIEAVFPGWQIMDIIGGGINSTVYRIHRSGEADQALKVVVNAGAQEEISALRAKGEAFANEFKKGMTLNWDREAEILRTVNECAHVVRTHECRIIENESGVPEFLIRMELLEKLTDAIPTMTVKDAVQMAKDICEAIDFCNQKRIIHCDIKPENIFRDDQGRYKLGDFSSAIYTSETNRPPRSTALYAAPETKEGKNFDSTVDLYALGLVLFGLLNGQYPPFIEDISEESFPSEEQINDSIEKRLRSAEDVGKALQATSELNEILNYACSYYPKDRYQTANEFAGALGKRLSFLAEKGDERLKFPAQASYAAHANGNAADGSRIYGEQTKNDGPIRDISVFGASCTRNSAAAQKNENKENAARSNEDKTAPEETSTDRIKGRISKIKEQITEYQQSSTSRKKKKKRIKIAILAGLALALVVAGCILIVLQTSKVSNLTASQDGFDLTVTWNQGGSGPWTVSVLSEDQVLTEQKVQARQATFRLAPGFSYTVSVDGAKADVSMKELPTYTGEDIELSWVKLQYYLVKSGNARGKTINTDHIDYSPFIGKEDEKGYLLCIAYEMPSRNDAEALCVLMSDNYLETKSIMLTQTDIPDFAEIELNDTLLAIGGKANELIYKIYVDGTLLARGTYSISQ